MAYDRLGFRRSPYGPIGDASTDGTQPALPGPGFASDFASRRACEDSNFWRAGAVKRAATLQGTGDVPVLLAAADHDGIMPGDANALERSAWQEQCGCDVSQFVLTDTGHAFMGHWSLRRWTSEVVGWLHDHRVR